VQAQVLPRPQARALAAVLPQTPPPLARLLLPAAVVLFSPNCLGLQTYTKARKLLLKTITAEQ
jgi:hypothetical protein